MEMQDAGSGDPVRRRLQTLESLGLPDVVMPHRVVCVAAPYFAPLYAKQTEACSI